MTNDDMSEDKLTALSRLELPEPSPEARRRALAAAMAAFDAEAVKNSEPTPQGRNWTERLRSIVQPKRGTWLMDTRITYGIGTAAIVLLLLPLGYQFLSSTSMTPVIPPAIDRELTPTPTDQNAVTTDAPVASKDAEPTPLADETATATTVAPNTTVIPPTPPADDSVDNRKVRTVTVKPDGSIASPEAPGESSAATSVPLAKTTTSEQTAVAAQPVPQMDQLASESGRAMATPDAVPAAAEPFNQGIAVPADMDLEAMAPPPPSPSPVAADAAAMVAPSQMAGSILGADNLPATVSPQESGDQFTDFKESPLKVVAEEPVSTFSIDVDTASYSYVRSTLEQGYIPAPDAVRIEELVNYFPYDYPTPTSADAPFQPTVAVYPTPWNKKTELMAIGIKGYVPTVTEDKPSNLTFLIDTSGSMEDANKLPLLRRAFALLVNQLGANDTVSIVVYAGSAGVVLPPTKATDKATILSALDNLSAGGSTAGAEGIELAYRLAEENKVANGINRVILATDGDFNVGIDDPNQLIDFIKTKRDSGVFLSVLGFGMGNYQDDTMQALAQNGNGNAAYIDSFREAQKVLVEEGGSTLETIAKDVKIQVEFNPAMVSEYRLIGYETRALNREDFNNDKVDAGDIGAGHTVTAIYEITPKGSGGELVDPLRYEADPGAAVATSTPTGELAFLKLRYKLPDEDVSKLIELPIGQSMVLGSIDDASVDTRFATAVAAFGQKLKGSDYGDISWDAIRSLAQGSRGTDDLGYRAEFMRMIDTAKLLAPDTTATPAPDPVPDALPAPTE